MLLSGESPIKPCSVSLQQLIINPSSIIPLSSAVTATDVSNAQTAATNTTTTVTARPESTVISQLLPSIVKSCLSNSVERAASQSPVRLPFVVQSLPVPVCCTSMVHRTLPTSICAASHVRQSIPGPLSFTSGAVLSALTSSVRSPVITVSRPRVRTVSAASMAGLSVFTSVF